MPESWSYYSATVIKIADGNYTNKYWEGQYIKITQTTDKFFVVQDVTYTDPHTYLTVYGGGVYTLVDAAITDHRVSLAQAPKGVPHDFDRYPQYVSGDTPASINYIGNPDAEVGTTGWATYDDGAVAAPIDGTGGSPSITLTRNTTTPLRGSGDFDIYANGTDCIGEGVSYDFTIDKADQGNMLTISFDFANSVTINTEGTHVVYIYDKTNAVLIQPTPYKIPAHVAGVYYHWSGQFQTSIDSTSYRLILFHRATSSTVVRHIYFDNVAVGPSPMKQGVTVTDWVAYTPTLNSDTNVSAKSGQWRRVGDSIECRVGIAWSGAGSGALAVYGPSGVTLQGSTPYAAGRALWYDTGTSYKAGIVVCSSGDNYCIVRMDGESANWSQASAANGDTMNLYWTQQVTGWASNCQVSSDAETRVVAAWGNAGEGTANTAFADATEEIVDFNLIMGDSHGAVTTGASWKFTCPVSGFYYVSAGGIALGGTNVTEAYLAVKRNNVWACLLAKTNAAATANCMALSGSGIIWCNAGDYIQFFIKQDNTDNTDRTLFVTSSWCNYFSIFRVSGPSQIAASEKVVAVYTSNSGQSIANNSWSELVEFEDKVIDTHNAYNVGTGEFIVPVSGYYLVSAGVRFASGTGFNGTTEYALLWAGFSMNMVVPGTVDIQYSIACNSIEYKLAGEIINTGMYQSSGAAISLTTANNYTYLCITRL